MDWAAIVLTIQLATATTAILFLIGIPLAYWLASSKSPARTVVDVVVAMPLVLPPTVLGFYLLILLGPRGWVGSLVEHFFQTRLVFTFGGMLIASVVFNLPFAVRPFMATFVNIDQRLIEASWCLGISKWETFRRVTIPLCWPGILSGMILTFAHTLGEFGVVLMIGGNIPGKTRTLSIAIYDQVQAMEYDAANRTAVALLAVSFVVICLAQCLSRRGTPV